MIAALRYELTRAQTALARGDFRRARARAEALLYDWAPDDLRAAALLVAADAAHATGAYRDALGHYGAFLSLRDRGPNAAHAAVQMGWAQLREGQRDAARLSWAAMADRFPDDARAPIVLVLAAEIAIQDGDTVTAIPLLDRVIGEFPSSEHAGTARLSRSILALRQQREERAAEDLEEVIRSHGTSAVDARSRTLHAVGIPDGKAARSTSAAAGGVAATAPSRHQAGASNDPLAQFATAFLRSGDPGSAPYVLHGLSLVGAVDRGWSDFTVATLVHRLAAGWPSYPAAPELLGRVASAAASAGQWPIARRTYDVLSARYRGTSFTSAAAVTLAETLMRAGAPAEARAYLGDAIAAGGDIRARALLALAEIEAGLGNRSAALAAYDRVAREHPHVERSVTSLLSHARLLESAGQPDGARSLLERVVEASEGDVAGEAAYRIAGILSAQGREEAAADWYMTAAYVAQGSRWERPGLLGAVRAFTALDQTDEALIAYRKAIAMPMTVEPGGAVSEVSASPLLAGQPGQRPSGDAVGDVSLRLADALRRAGSHETALEMYLSIARAGRGPAAPRALVGAIGSLVAAGNRAYAEAIYQRLLESGTSDPALLAEARRTIDRLSP
jgi:TolA-binding protein